MVDKEPTAEIMLSNAEETVTHQRLANGLLLRRETMLSDAEATVTPWPESRERLTNGTHWLATVRPNGWPHMVPIGVVWIGNLLYFTSGQGTRKGVNLAHNAHCVISTSTPGFDLIVEGEAVKVSDVAKLQQVAEVYAAQGWPATVRDGVLTAPYSAPTTGPAPYDVYEVTPRVAFALGTEEQTVNHSNRYRF